MQNLTEFFKVVKKIAFIQGFTGLNISSGILVRVVGKGTTSKDKRTEPTDAEKVELKAGWEQFKKAGDKIFNSL